MVVGDGDVDVGVALAEARDRGRQAHMRCPVCGKRLTMGVLQRVEDLADRPAGARPEAAPGCRNLLPLDEVVAEVTGSGRPARPCAGPSTP